MAITSKTQSVSVVVRWRDAVEPYGDDIVFPMADVAATHGHNVRAFINSNRSKIEKEKKDRVKKWKDEHGRAAAIRVPMPEEVLIQVKYAAESDERKATYTDAIYYSPEGWPMSQAEIDAEQARRVAAWEEWVRNPPPPPPDEPPQE